MRKQFGVDYIPDSLFHIFVPKAIDNGVQHGHHDCKKHSGHFEWE